MGVGAVTVCVGGAGAGAGAMAERFTLRAVIGPTDERRALGVAEMGAVGM